MKLIRPLASFGSLASLAVACVAVASASVGCHHADPTPAPVGPVIPKGQVWLSDQQAKEAQIETAAVADQDVDDTILTSGRVTFDDLRVAHIYSPVTGKVTQISAQLGQRVTAGQALASIESPDIGSAVSDLNKADADLIAAEHAYKREKDLAAKSASTQVDLETAEDNYRKAKAEMERAQQKTSLLRSGGANSVNGSYTLYSPIDGEVIMRNLNPGIEVQGQYGGNQVTELFTVGELDSVWVIADIYEMDLARVKVGSPCVVTTVAYKDTRFEGKVDWVSGMLDATTRTAKVRCTFDNKARMLKPEMYATAQISVEQRKALAIPRNSILRLGDQTIVFVQVSDDGGTIKYAQTPVVVDEGESSNWLVVQQGLDVGQTVVTSGAIKLAANL